MQGFLTAGFKGAAATRASETRDTNTMIHKATHLTPQPPYYSSPNYSHLPLLTTYMNTCAPVPVHIAARMNVYS